MDIRTLAKRSLPENSLQQGALLGSTLPPPENQIYYPALDGLRAVAALLVFLQHYVLYRFPPAFRWGWAGVDLFFVLSGFLITGILFDTQDDRHRFRTFYIRRALRIFPLYYGVFLLALITTPFFLWRWCKTWLLFAFYLGNYTHLLSSFMGCGPSFEDQLYSQRLGVSLLFGHFWSLCVEEQFYLAWPCVVFFVRNRVRLIWICAAIILLCPIVRAAALFFAPQPLLQEELLYRATFLRMDSLAVGGAVALILRGPLGERLKRLAPRLLLLSFSTFVVCWIVAVWVLHQDASGEFVKTQWIPAVGYSLIDLIAAFILLATIKPGTLCFRLFSYKPLRLLGQRTYGFYIFHYLFIAIYANYLPNLILRFTKHLTAEVIGLPFVFTVALSFLSFRYFESPFLRLKSRFTRETGRERLQHTEISSRR